MKLRCWLCGKPVSNEIFVPEDSIIIRGTIECPECAINEEQKNNLDPFCEIDNIDGRTNIAITMNMKEAKNVTGLKIGNIG